MGSMRWGDYSWEPLVRHAAQLTPLVSENCLLDARGASHLTRPIICPQDHVKARSRRSQ